MVFRKSQQGRGSVTSVSARPHIFVTQLPPLSYWSHEWSSCCIRRIELTQIVPIFCIGPTSLNELVPSCSECHDWLSFPGRPKFLTGQNLPEYLSSHGDKLTFRVTGHMFKSQIYIASKAGRVQRQLNLINTELLPRQIWNKVFRDVPLSSCSWWYWALMVVLQVYEPIRDFHQALHLGAPGLLRNRPLDFWRMIRAPGPDLVRSRPYLHRWWMVIWGPEGGGYKLLLPTFNGPNAGW